MSSAEPRKPTILVTDASRGSAIAIIRALGRRGWHIIAADLDRRSSGFRSRYTCEQLIYPDPALAPRECVTTLLGAARAKKIDLIIPVTDQIILPLSDSRSLFEGICKLALPDATALSVTVDKLKTLQLAERLGIPAPETRLVYTVQEAIACGQDLGWPVVLKPQASLLYRRNKGSERFSVCFAEGPAHLEQQMRRFEGRCSVLLQEYTPGIGQGVEMLAYLGRPLAAFQHTRLREIPINGGVSAFRQSAPLDPILYSHAADLLRELKWTGLAMVEFKAGKGKAKLMEINGRVWGSLPLAVHCGMDFPGRLADLYLYGPPEFGLGPDTLYKVGGRASNLELSMIWIAQVIYGRRRYPFLPMPPRRQGLAAMAELLKPGQKFDIFSLDDPKPGWAEIKRIIARCTGKLKETSRTTLARLLSNSASTLGMGLTSTARKEDAKAFQGQINPASVNGA